MHMYTIATRVSEWQNALCLCVWVRERRSCHRVFISWCIKTYYYCHLCHYNYCWCFFTSGIISRDDDENGDYNHHHHSPFFTLLQLLTMIVIILEWAHDQVYKNKKGPWKNMRPFLLLNEYKLPACRALLFYHLLVIIIMINFY